MNTATIISVGIAVVCVVLTGYLLSLYGRGGNLR